MDDKNKAIEDTQAFIQSIDNQINQQFRTTRYHTTDDLLKIQKSQTSKYREFLIQERNNRVEEVAQYKKISSDLQGKLQQFESLENSNTQLNKELEEAKLELKSELEKSEQLIKENSKLTNDLKASQSAVNSESEKYSQIKELNFKLQSDLEELKSKFQFDQGKFDQTETDCESEYLKTIQNKFPQIKISECKTPGDRVLAYRKVIDELSTQLADSSNKNSELRGSIDLLEKSTANLKLKIPTDDSSSKFSLE